MIDFVSAENNGLTFSLQSGDEFSSTDVNELAKFASRVGFAEQLMGSSSMDFASEEGFESDDGAQLLLKRVFELV